MMYIAVTFNTPTPDLPKAFTRKLLGSSDRHSVYRFDVHQSRLGHYRKYFANHPQVQMFSVSTPAEWKKRFGNEA